MRKYCLRIDIIYNGMDLNELFEDFNDVDLVNIVEEEMANHREYYVRERIDHFHFWNNLEFFHRFRLSKDTVLEILHRVEGQIANATNRNLDRAVTPLQKLLLALRYLATGSFYVTIGDFAGIHKTTASKIIKTVLIAICNMRAEYINFAENEIEAIQRKFYEIARFPRVIGALDCTHIKLESRGGDNAEVFRNRKGFFSLNCQMVCDANLKIRDLVCRWPGSAHDNHIFNNSALKMKFETRQFRNCVLVADRGYPLRQYIQTPIENPRDEVETLYNESQIRTRNVIERTFGILKRRFPILSLGIRCKGQLPELIIVACAILHNIARDFNEAHFDDQLVEHNELDDDVDINDNEAGAAGARAIFLDYFRNLYNNI